MFFLRLLDYLTHIPLRVWRLLNWLLWLKPLKGKHKIWRWLAGIFLLAIDITPVPFLLEWILDWVKVKTRPLDANEKKIAASVFGKSIPYHLIGLDPASIPAVKKHLVAFVTFRTINFDTKIPSYTFIHELVHIWQYQKLGSVYISESIWAQRWGGGYNYGGTEALNWNYGKGGLYAFNFEQQADIVEDYFRLKNDLPLQWAARDAEIERVLEIYMIQLNE